MIKKILLLAFFSVFVVGCATMMQREAELPDLPPPADYKPIFITETVDINSLSGNSLDLELSRYEINDDEKVTVFFHLIGNQKAFALNSSSSNLLKRFCGGKLLTKEGEIPIEKLNVKESVLKDRKPLAIVIALDHSGSMGEYRAYDCQDAVIDFIRSKALTDLISIIKYDNNILTEVPLTNNSAFAINKFKRNGLLDFGGMTAISDAIDAGIDELANVGKEYKKMVIVFTDGWDNSSRISFEQVVQKAKKNNVIINAVDFGYGINEGYMQQFSIQTHGIYKHIYKKDEFSLLFQDIINRYEYYYTTQIALPEFGEYKFVLNYCIENKVLSDTITINNIPNIGDITLLNVYFDTDKFNLKSESMKAIKKVAKLMTVFPNITIEISGHTDSQNRTNDPNYNLKLSQNRADEVRKALIKEGIEDFRIFAKGYGDSIPIADNSTKDGRALNRRTEFIILKK